VYETTATSTTISPPTTGVQATEPASTAAPVSEAPAPPVSSPDATTERTMLLAEIYRGGPLRRLRAVDLRTTPTPVFRPVFRPGFRYVRMDT
jgi:hypothetical protein